MDENATLDDATEPPSRAPRSHLMQLAQIIDDSGATADIRIRNISASGLAGASDLSLAVGALVKIRFKTGETKEGAVVWVAGGKFGVSFSSEIAADAIVTGASAQSDQAEPFVLRNIHRPVADHRRPSIGPSKR
jgi:hypothetical protein